jgi:hypothetical protein
MIQEIRTDRGGEFVSSRIKTYMAQRGVVMKYAPPYTPQYQGKVERMNRTVGEMAHSMRVAAGMPLEFWGLAWEAAVYLRNRCPTKSNEGHLTPYQVLFAKIPDLSHIRVFGARGEAFVQPQLRLKGQDKSNPGRIVGYDEISRAYRFLPDGQKRFIIVRSIKCDEWSTIDMHKACEMKDEDEKQFEVIHQRIKSEDTKDIVKYEVCKHESDEKVPERKPEQLIKGERRLTRSQLKERLE